MNNWIQPRVDRPSGCFGGEVSRKDGVERIPALDILQQVAIEREAGGAATENSGIVGGAVLDQRLCGASSITQALTLGSGWPRLTSMSVGPAHWQRSWAGLVARVQTACWLCGALWALAIQSFWPYMKAR